MKSFFLAITVLAVLALGTRNLETPAYGSHYYAPHGDSQYQQYLQWQHYLQWQEYLEYLRQNDPYYELRAMHYQLFLRPYQPHQIYPPCCYAGGVALPRWSTPISPWP